MSDPPRKVYWDSGLFICFLNRSELERRKICEDILRCARDGKIRIYTSTWTIVEVVRPSPKSLPTSQVLTPEQIGKIRQMFEWDWIVKIQVDQRVAFKAVELARDHGLRPADAVHAASAILNKLDAIQKWDRDFGKISHLIQVEEPQFISKQPSLIEDSKLRLGPHPDDFTKP